MPQRILQRRKQQRQDDRMDIDDEDREQPFKKTKEAAKAKDNAVKNKPFWEDIRKDADVLGISDKLLTTVVPITLKELLPISPDLISNWFGVKRVPSLPAKEKDLKEAFEVSAAKWISKADEPLFGCAAPRCRGSIEDTMEEEMLIDCGSELCLLSKNFFDTLGIPIDLEIVRITPNHPVIMLHLITFSFLIYIDILLFMRGLFIYFVFTYASTLFSRIYLSLSRLWFPCLTINHTFRLLLLHVSAYPCTFCMLFTRYAFTLISRLLI